MKKILIIEDDKEIREIYTEILKDEGLEIFSTENGKEGLELARTKNPQLILLDLLLPPAELNGLAILKILKKDPLLRSIPVLMMTNLDGEKNTALSAGASGYIIKADTSISELVKKVKGALEKRR